MPGNPFRRFLDEQGIVVLDGGLATALEADGYVLDSDLWSARLLLDAPEAVRAVHTAYLEAGADCITTATYQASFDAFGRLGVDAAAAADLMRGSVRLAVEARSAFWSEPVNRAGRLEPIVAASAGPYGAFLADGSEYDGRYGVDQDVLDTFHRARLEVLAETDADLIAFETIPSLPEVEVIAALLSETPATWAWITFSCRDGRHLWDGSPVAEAARACSVGDGVAGVGVNCTSPRFVVDLIDEIRGATDLPIIAYPNSGETYDAAAKVWTGQAVGSEWLAGALEWVGAGARVVGGCCRVGPDMIRELRGSVAELAS